MEGRPFLLNLKILSPQIYLIDRNDDFGNGDVLNHVYCKFSDLSTNITPN